MALVEEAKTGGIRLAVEGCGHGTLHNIYTTVEERCKFRGWDGVDLLIIGGDFQAVRNQYDLNVTSMPQKYRRMADFHEYYSGAVVAPYLTIFIGGNHEASNHLFELYYGGWVAPNIYYLGAANVLQFGPLRIAGLTGIWKGYDYNKPHFERLPYNQEEIGSIYHVRELDTRKLLSLRSQVDIGLSHDWPQAIEMHGDYQRLFKYKSFLEPDSRSGKLGSVAAKRCLDHLRPPYWFSAHLHTRFVATVNHGNNQEIPHAVTNDARSIASQSSLNSMNANKQQGVAPSPRSAFKNVDQQRVSAWQQFGVAAKKADAEEADQIKREHAARRGEEERTGIRQGPQYDFNETFHQVKGDGTLERTLISTTNQQVRNRDLPQSPEPISNLDGCGFSRPIKRQRVVSPNASDRQNLTSPETVQDTQVGDAVATSHPQVHTNPDAIDIEISDESDSGVRVNDKVADAARSSVKFTNPDAIDIDMSDSSDDGAEAEGGGAEPTGKAPTAANSSTTLSGTEQAKSKTISLNMSEASEDGGVKLSPSVSVFDSTLQPSQISTSDSQASKESIIPSRRSSDSELNPEAKSFTPKASTASLSAPETVPQPSVEEPAETKVEESEVSEEMRAQLAALSSNFTQREEPKISASLPFPEDITNKTTHFLALSKCESNQEFLELMEVSSLTKPDAEIKRPLKLSYDPEWLAIQRVFAPELTLGGTSNDRIPPHRGDTYYHEQIVKEQAWITEHVVNAGRLEVPENFTHTAPMYDPEIHVDSTDMPREVTNPQTSAFCQLIGIENKFDISEEERDFRVQQGPRPESAGYLASRDRPRGGHRGGGRGGGGRGGRGGRGGGRGSGGSYRGRGRW
ncbi:hypothetical protein LTR84_009773 [Exophiala bonariae]|uniref:Lariat debranching enzyme C-terminal domain-containing protein n=1 Tax=Exophiala bonariae TaxID=1690606 RepID=A0AAV9NLS5_9EURO|nr:hypothetical protein LTR84_009773 [Exophiala bonariae]